MIAHFSYMVAVVSGIYISISRTKGSFLTAFLSQKAFSFILSGSDMFQHIFVFQIVFLLAQFFAIYYFADMPI